MQLSLVKEASLWFANTVFKTTTKWQFSLFCFWIQMIPILQVYWLNQKKGIQIYWKVEDDDLFRETLLLIFIWVQG